MTEESQTATLETDTVELQEVSSEDVETPGILRTPSDGCFEVYQGPWGKYIRPCFDPEANVEITKEHLEHFELNSNIHKIPSDLWARWVKLCFHFVDKVKDSVEVSVRILRSQEDASKYRILVPRQKVSGATVRVDSFEESIDIETGEELTEYPPVGWIPVGSSHSHNTMNAFFSGTDDKYELGDPGIHLVVGAIKPESRKYEIAASVVGSGRRFIMHYSDLIDATPVDSVTFHPKVVDYVDYTSPLATTFAHYTNKSTKKYSGKTTGKEWNSYQEWLKQYSSYGESEDWNDPYFYSENYSSYGNETAYKEKGVKLWEVEDVANDYISQNQDSLEKLINLKDTLDTLLREVESGIALHMELLKS